MLCGASRLTQALASMLLVVLITTALLAADQGPDSYPVVLHIERSPSCLRDRPVTNEDLAPKLAWKDKTTALVTLVAYDEYNAVTSERAPRAQVAGGELNLCYNYEPPIQSQYHSTCGPPALLQFTVSRVPQAEYKVHVASCWPAG